jgi:predicted metalloprotease with PDZ domain
MHASRDFAVPGPTFDFLVGHEHLHTWIPERFGAMHGDDADDEALHYWFSEGFTNFYTHRLLVAAGLWSLDDYAAGLNRVVREYLISPVRRADNARVRAEFFSDRAVGRLPYQRGEFLALRWHAALRTGGHAGLDAVMKGLLLPSAVARASAPGRPMATDRLLDALRPLVGRLADDDVARFVQRGETFEFDAGLLGPCFAMQVEQRAVYELGFDRRSLDTRRLAGVDPNGPAWAAGLRDGQELAGFSVHHGEADKEAFLQLREPDGRVRELSYRPVARETMPTPVYAARPGAPQDAACRAWLGS